LAVAVSLSGVLNDIGELPGSWPRYPLTIVGDAEVLLLIGGGLAPPSRISPFEDLI
jgi:hypothetical protein